MTKEQAIDAISKGNMVFCTKEEYQTEIRTAIQDQAGKWINEGDNVKSIIALQEVKRLDALFEYKFI
jgi:hypothetical protein